MSIKGTLETFNLLDLLQMLSFNQKVGTLALETANGPRTLFVESGTFGFVQGDPLASRAIARVLRRTEAVAPDRLDRGLSIVANSGRFLGDVLIELGALDPERRKAAWVEAVQELFFDLLQTSITRFEFVEGKSLAPDGKEGQAILPLCGVDGVLLELTRKIDEWAVLKREVPSEDEVFEGTGTAPAVAAIERLPEHVAARVIPLIDGRRSVSLLVSESDCDRFSVLKLLSGLLHQGAVRASPTEALLGRAEDLISRGAASDAVPLLRRSVDRGEAPPRTRLRLADALEAAADPRGAAAELDTYATQNAESDPVGTFDAVLRVLRLRGGDAAAAARVCDHFLRHRDLLVDRGPEAMEALRRLIHAASTGGRPLEAATRLETFVENGDAPSEDLLVLADLQATGGRPEEAATSLVRRAETLVGAERPVAARELLRRALGYDPTRVDARRRLNEIEGAERRRRHRRRMVVLLLLLAMTVGTAGGVWLVWDGRAAKAVDGALSNAEEAAKVAETRVGDALGEWNVVLANAAKPDAPPTDLAPFATALREKGRVATNDLREALAAASSEIGSRAGATGRGEAGRERVRTLEGRMRALQMRVEGAVRDASERGAKALVEGEQAYKEGRFRAARPLLLEAVRLSFEDREEVRTRAEQAHRRLDQVETYMSGVEAAKASLDAALAKGDRAEAWRIGSRLLATFLDSDLTRDVRLPVPVSTEPAGASLHLGGVDVGSTTPSTLLYSPFGAVDLRLRTPGHVPVEATLPCYKDVLSAERTKTTTPFVVSARMTPGPRWTSSPPGGYAAGPFVTAEGAYAVSADGRHAVLLRAAEGRSTEVRGLQGIEERVRLVGRAGGGTWTLIGLRTFGFTPESGRPWQVQTLGRLDRAPAFSGGVVALVDETGIVYAVEAATGTPRWKRELSAPPAQAPLASSLGFLVSTTAGEALALSPADGTPRALPASKGRAVVFAAPWRDGALLLGGGEGVRVVTSALETRVVGPAEPDLAIVPVVAADGIAWVEKGGGIRALAHDREKTGTVAVPAAEKVAFAPAMANGVLYAVGVDGRLRAVRLETPLVLLWSTPIRGTARSAPEVLADLVLVRTDAGIIGVER